MLPDNPTRSLHCGWELQGSSATFSGGHPVSVRVTECELCSFGEAVLRFLRCQVTLASFIINK